jgi:hypothetical protein
MFHSVVRRITPASRMTLIRAIPAESPHMRFTKNLREGTPYLVAVCVRRSVC